MNYVAPQIGRVAVLLPLLLLWSCACGPRPAPESGPAAVATASLCPPGPISNAGLTDEQRVELQKAEGWRCYGVWVASLGPSTIPNATLGHTGMAANYQRPDGGSLSEAKANATLVVGGTVLALRPQTTGFATKVTITVTATFKGQAGNTIVVHQGSHLEPRDNWKNIVIVDASNAPPLRPGEAVFLFLKSGPERLYQMSFTGTYYVRDGRIQALEMNPFASKVNGLLPADFIAAVAAA